MISKTQLRRWALPLFAIFLCSSTSSQPDLSAARAISFPQRNQDEAKRDTWQRPDEVMTALGIGPGSTVADIGCREGYFVVRLAKRVGESGTVYGVDVDEDSLKSLRKRVERDKLGNVRVIQGTPDNPMFPAQSGSGGLDAILVVNAYHEMKEFDSMLRAMYAALKPGGRLAIIDAIGEENASRSKLQSAHESSEPMVREDVLRAGFRFRSKERGFERPESSRRHWFFLIFEK